MQNSGKPEVAFYYPNPIWRHGEWVKNLILLFDGIALLVPEYMRDKPEIVDPALVAGLTDANLLHILEPEQVIDRTASEELASALASVIASGILDELANDRTDFHEISYSRLGGYGDPGLAAMILDELKRRRLARPSEDGVSIPMHPLVRALVLVLLSQILRPKGLALGLSLSPATDRPKFVRALEEFLSLPQQASAPHVVSFDLLTVGVDLSTVPIDEVLDYRRRNLKSYRAYARGVRKFLHELSLMDESERTSAFSDRQEELEDLASDLRKRSRDAWKKPATFALGLAGAVWNAVSGDPLGALLAAASGGVGSSSRKSEASAFSYLFTAAEELH